MDIYSLDNFLEYKKDLVYLIRKSEPLLHEVFIKGRPNPWGQGICSSVKILISGKKPINVTVTLLGEVLCSDKYMYPIFTIWLNDVKSPAQRQKERCRVLKQELLEHVLANDNSS